MTRFIFGITALAALQLSTARVALAQAADSWPSAGARLVRVDERSMSPTSDLANGACATRMRDPRTGREYMVRHSTAKTETSPHDTGPTTSATTRLLNAIGEYARVESKGDTLSTRVVSVDCLNSRVIARRAGT